MPSYAVRVGREPGIYSTWYFFPSEPLPNLTPGRAECEAQVKGFHDAKFKKFNSPSEAKAWIAGNGSPVKSSGTSTEAGGSDTKGKKRMRDESIYDVVYSDGACKGNGQVGSVAGVGVWWGRDDPR